MTQELLPPCNREARDRSGVQAQFVPLFVSQRLTNLFVRESPWAEPEVRGQSENEKVRLTTLGRSGNFYDEYMESEPQWPVENLSLKGRGQCQSLQ